MILNDFLSKSAKNFPKSLAYSMKFGYRTKKFDYQQVYDLSKKAALFLESLGLKKGDKILIFAPNSPYWAILFWASLQKGIIVVPINVQNRSETIKKIIKQTEAKLIFKSRFLRRDLPQEFKVFEIELLEELIEHFDSKNFKPEDIQESDVAEILYTSGTTGDPKGVVLTHKNIVSNVLAVDHIFGLEQGKERILSVLPLTHIFEQTIGFFLTSFYAAHVVYTHSYGAILSLLQDYKITKILLVPEFLKILMSKIKAEAEKTNRLAMFNFFLKISSKLKNRFISKLFFKSIHNSFGGCLDTIGSGGAFLDPLLEKDWNNLGFYILQGYGLTETSPVITCNTYKDHKFASVGKVISKDIQLKMGKDGEILVKGPNVFTQYYKDSEKTSACFDSDGFLKTGDMGYFDSEGYLFLSGRKKYLIIGPGGQNVFPEDVETEINKIKGVKDSAVLGVVKESGYVEIHAVLILSDKSLNPDLVIQKANSNLASYQQVTGWTIWNEQDFPRSATRKIKKDDVLKKISSDHLKNGKAVCDETILKKILSQISGIEISKMKDDSKIIIDLKFDSLMLVELLATIEQDFGVLIDQSCIKSETSLIELQNLIDKKEKISLKPKLSRWPRSFWATKLRMFLQFFAFLVARLFIKLKVYGVENIKSTKLPVIFMPNHTSYIDPIVLAMALPYNIRRKLAFASAQDVLYGDYKKISWLADLLFNSFPLPRTEGQDIRWGLENVGDLLDKNYSIVVFPEGAVSIDGKLKSLRTGAGLIAVEMDVFIVPVKISGACQVLPYEKFIPRKRGLIEITFGKPIKFNKNESYLKAKEKIEQIMKSDLNCE